MGLEEARGMDQWQVEMEKSLQDPYLEPGVDSERGER